MATAFRHPLEISPDRLAPRIGSWPGPALLESGPGFGQAGRWSILSAWPRRVIEATDGVATVREGDAAGGSVVAKGPVWPTLAAELDRFGLVGRNEPAEGLPPFQGGLIGYLGYDLAPLIERLPRKAPRDSRFPDLRLALYDTAVIVDHKSGGVDLWAFDLLGEGKAATARRAEHWQAAIAVEPKAPGRSVPGKIRGQFTREGYVAAVDRALEYVKAGDIFQVNISQRFESVGKPVPLDLYLRAKRLCPAPFGAFLAWDDLAVVSASPEWFYQTRGDRIVTRPIKGTRPRGGTPEEDARMLAELAASPKDRAELTMIIDLERNDLGRICQYGSIKVVEAMAVESFAQVHHLVATIQGRLWPKTTPVEVVQAVFPGGSITGAPKIRAMEIIDELEPTRRSVYTGAIGYFSQGGVSAFNIAIRTLLVEGERVSFQVGGGIVADSDPLAEYHETLHKGRGLREVLEGSEARGSPPP